MEKFFKNTFNKGWLKDIAPDKFPQEAYTELINGRLLCKDSLRSGSITNIKGNLGFWQTPFVPATWRGIFIQSPVHIKPDFTISIIIYLGSIPYFTTFTIVGPSVSSIAELSQILANAIEDNNPSPFTLYATADGEDIMIGLSGGGTIGLTIVINIIDQNNLQRYSFAIDSPSIIEGACKIIGWTMLRDSIILFTTSNNVDGQIWKVDYDVSSLAITYLLVYYNKSAGFTTLHPIINEAKALYETENIQRVYWTDNWNPPRKLNLADKNSFFLTPLQLSNLPVVAMKRPIITSLTDGNLSQGVYQIGYILKSSITQKKSVLSPLSGEVNIVFTKEDANARYWGQSPTDSTAYHGGMAIGVAAKSINGKVMGLDNNSFDLIDFVVFKRDNYLSASTQQSYFSVNEKIPDNGTVTFVCTDFMEPYVPSAIDFFIKNITRVKTIDVKDNVLFYGNVRMSGMSDLRFNARAYRYLAGSSLTYLNGSDVAEEGDVNWDKDAINSFNFLGSELISGLQYAYKKNSNTLGGWGPNVEYEFTAVELDGDKYGSTVPTTWPFMEVDKTSNVIDMGIAGEQYSNNNFWFDYKSPMVNVALRGYMPGEVYRFGLLLYDAIGNPAYINWIGDIKFPEMQQLYTLGDSSYNLIKADGKKLKTLGIKFKINIPGNIVSNISGYRIVRVHRDEEDMTRIDTGILSVLHKVHERFAQVPLIGDTTYTFHHYWAFIDGSINFSSMSGQSVTGLGTNFYRSSFDPEVLFSFDSPLVQFGGKNPFRSGDKLRVEFGTESYQNNIGVYLAYPGTINKYYLSSYPSTIYYDILDMKYIGEYANPVSNQFYGFDVANLMVNPSMITGVGLGGPENFNKLHFQTTVGYGCRTSVLDVTNNSSLYNEISSTETLAQKKLITTLCRSLTNQYGGANENTREHNSYIGCCNFIPSDNMPAGYFTVFGGDVYVGIYDSIKSEIANGIVTPSGSPLPAGSVFNGYVERTIGDPINVKSFKCLYYPVVGRYNTLLRSGRHFSTKAKSNGTLYDNSTLFEDFWFHGNDPGTYSNVDDLFSFYPVPSTVNFAEEFDNRIMASAHKITGEQYDSWSQFDGTDILVDGIHGPINKIITHHDNLYFFQDRAYGRVNVYPRTAVPDIGSSSSSVAIETGTVLQGFDYISLKRGTKHQFSVFKSPGAIYFWDGIEKRLVKFDNEQGTRDISDIDGIKSVVSSQIVSETDNILSNLGVHGIYDTAYNMPIFTFKGTSELTVGYNEIINAWENKITAYPSFWMEDSRNLFSIDYKNSPSTIWIHDKGDMGNFYGIISPTSLSFIINPDYEASKIFDIMNYNSEFTDTLGADKYNETFNTVSCSGSNYQDTGTVLLTPGVNIRRRLRTWHLNVPKSPSDTGGRPPVRMRGHWMETMLSYDNITNRRIYLGNILTGYRIMVL